MSMWQTEKVVIACETLHEVCAVVDYITTNELVGNSFSTKIEHKVVETGLGRVAYRYWHAEVDTGTKLGPHSAAFAELIEGLTKDDGYGIGRVAYHFEDEECYVGGLPSKWVREGSSSLAKFHCKLDKREREHDEPDR